MTAIDEFCRVSKEFLFFEAAIIWLAGSAGCFIQGVRQVMQGTNMLNDDDAIDDAKNLSFIFSWILSVCVGLTLAKFIFLPLLNKNLTRIRGLESSNCWDCYRIYFYIFLVFCDGGSVTLTELFAKGHPAAMISIGCLDLTVAFALGFSFFGYINEYKRFMRSVREGRSAEGLTVLDESDLRNKLLV